METTDYSHLPVADQLRIANDRFETEERTRRVRLFCGTHQRMGRTQHDCRECMRIWLASPRG